MKRQILTFLGRLTRKYGLPKGGWRMLEWLFPSSYCKDIEVIFEFGHNLLAEVNLGSYLERKLFFTGAYNIYVEQIVEKLISPGAIAMDCGANIGMYTLRMARKIGKEGKVIAIEPHEFSRKRLIRNLSLNNLLDRVNILPIALSDKIGKTTFYYPPPEAINQGDASLYPKSPNWRSVEVEVSTIDKIAKDLNLNHVELIRADVQGEEYKTLKGAKEVIEKYRPIISIRYQDYIAKKANMNIEELGRFILSFGYDIFIAERDILVKINFSQLTSLKNAELFFVGEG